MRPGGLGEILDDAGDVVVALDQQHVARPQHGAQRVGIARRERLVARLGALQIAGDLLSDAAKHPVHDSRFPFWGAFLTGAPPHCAPKLAETHCNCGSSPCDCGNGALAMTFAARRGFRHGMAGIASRRENHLQTMKRIDPPKLPGRLRRLRGAAGVRPAASAGRAVRRDRRASSSAPAPPASRPRASSPRPAGASRWSRRPTASAGAASPRREASACRSIAARTGFTRRTSIR